MAEGQPGGEGLDDEEAAGAVAGADGSGRVQQRARIEDLDHFRMRLLERLSVGLAEPGEDPGQLPGARLVEALEKAEVTRSWEADEIVVGKIGRPLAEEDVDGEVLVDHQHERDRSGVVVSVVTTEQGVRCEVGIERCLELVGEVASRDAPEDLPAFGRDAGVARTAAAAAFLEQLLADGHELQCAARPVRLAPRSTPSQSWE